MSNEEILGINPLRAIIPDITHYTFHQGSGERVGEWLLVTDAQLLTDAYPSDADIGRHTIRFIHPRRRHDAKYHEFQLTVDGTTNRQYAIKMQNTRTSRLSLNQALRLAVLLCELTPNWPPEDCSTLLTHSINELNIPEEHLHVYAHQ